MVEMILCAKMYAQQGGKGTEGGTGEVGTDIFILLYIK